MKRLDLDGCALGDRSVEMLRSALPHSRLEQLDLRGNPAISEESCRDLRMAWAAAGKPESGLRMGAYKWSNLELDVP